MSISDRTRILPAFPLKNVMFRLFSPLITLLFPIALLAQDTVQWVPYTGAFTFNEGIYFNFEAFRNNSPSVPKEDLRNAQGLPITDIRQVVSKLYWQPDTGDRKAVHMDRLWGFCQNNVIYVRAGNGFYRIGRMGSLAHMVYEQTYRDWDPYLYPGGTVQRTYIVQQLIDMRTGQVLPFNAKGMDTALQHDQLLLEEFRALPKRKRNSDEALYRFLQLHNDRHLLELPVQE